MNSLVRELAFSPINSMPATSSKNTSTLQTTRFFFLPFGDLCSP